MGHKEHGGTWHMEAAQLDTQRKKGEAILKTSSTVTRPTGRVPQLDRPSFNSIELGSQSLLEHLEHMGREEQEGLGHGRSSTGYAKEEGGSHLEDQLDHSLLDQPVEFLNSTGQASTRSS
ncbi:unnamed protein product [Microthlaspi erraticum]|uniref:Uncharacterized protein n=1 Tax=Microthlaspi erraticum TaxID=1685480 RepID=A0A6D2KCP0_9BRAS|nr:unnamed protein product [Microthlaspi erraticum]